MDFEGLATLAYEGCIGLRFGKNGPFGLCEGRRLLGVSQEVSWIEPASEGACRLWIDEEALSLGVCTAIGLAGGWDRSGISGRVIGGFRGGRKRSGFRMCSMRFVIGGTCTAWRKGKLQNPNFQVQIPRQPQMRKNGCRCC